MGWIRKVYIDQRSTHQGFFGLKGVQVPTRPKVIVNRVTSAHWSNCARRRGKAARQIDAQLISRWLGNYGKEACGFPDGHLIEQTRGRCPHILALANTRIALRAWREDSGDITRILLTAVADPLARQGAEMSDTITIYTRILLTTQDLHGKKIDHGGSGGVRGTRGSR